jgi:hypothetical protein
VVEPSFIKLIGFDRIIDGVSHIFDAKLDSSSSIFSSFDLVRVELGESVGVVTDCCCILRGFTSVIDD